MSYERDLSAVFGRKAQNFSAYQQRVLRRLWNAGRREGVHRTHGEMKEFVRALPLEEKPTEEMPYKKFSPETAELMGELWRSVFLEGRDRGQQRIQTIFTRVISKEPLHEVFDQTTVTANNGSVCVGLKPWVQEAFQAVLDASDLDAAQEAADKAKAKHKRSREREQMLMTDRRASTDPRELFGNY